ncbi:hypothetical protein Micbo1qcDRAFT_194254 [Microdochium bolleyi]|uniref:Rho-GAP domain-containing protein n=1 Tax=Microdochium bolleyi TaxID=196109 RepID=A0A136J6W7_9PEZI|nr:hypothetical protein Micbo1qcDRAFT_194254 [Microdochium bolleyi]
MASISSTAPTKQSSVPRIDRSHLGRRRTVQNRPDLTVPKDFEQTQRSTPPDTLDRSQTRRETRPPPMPRSTNTWSSSSGDLGLELEHDVVDSRKKFVEEYNRLSRKYGVRAIVPGDFPTAHGRAVSFPRTKGRWLPRALGANLVTATAAGGAIVDPKHHNIKRHRSVGDIVLNLVHPATKSETAATEHLTSLVRMSGQSLLYLPSEYAARPLVLPTCLRATAQRLVQQGDTRGIFRIPGSVRIVNALYNYYHDNRDEERVSSTTRCPSLPSHINLGIHDIASVFKKVLGNLSGGILGSLGVFDALVAIFSQLQAEPELARTRRTRLRARLIALVLGTIQSRYQRDLACAVFGLLSFIGRQGEVASREDAKGRPLPTGELMGYNALGIIFGPLLVGDLLSEYSMKTADPAAGLVLFAITPPRLKRRSRKQKSALPKENDGVLPTTVDKLFVASSIVEMLGHTLGMVTGSQELQIASLCKQEMSESLSPPALVMPARLKQGFTHISGAQVMIWRMVFTLKLLDVA